MGNAHGFHQILGTERRAEEGVVGTALLGETMDLEVVIKLNEIWKKVVFDL